MSFSNDTIWIIGASSGIGEHIARNLSSQGATLILSARSEDKLKTLNKDLGGKHTILPFDISDTNQIGDAFKKAKNEHKKINRIICMAGIYEPKQIRDMDQDDLIKTVNINLIGVMAFAQKALNLLENQGYGQIALCASIAGYTGLPNGQPYSATKAALINFTQSLHTEANENIDIKLISPGFVKTPLTDKNNFKMPFIMKPEDAAKEIVSGLKRKSFEIDFPKKLTLTLKLISILPYPIRLAICKKMK